MASKVKPIPDGWHAVTPYLCIQNAAAAIDFYKKAFGAVEVMERLADPKTGKVGHAEIRIGDSLVMIADEHPDFGVFGPKTIGGSPVRLNLAVPDSDKTVAQAVAAGAKLVRPVEKQFYGWRSGAVEDPFGYQWMVGTCVEEVSPEEMARRWKKMCEEM